MLPMLFALVGASLFTGAAFYINFAEQPARLLLAPGQLVTQWVPSYHRGLIMQSSLAVVTGALGLYAFYRSENILWVVGSIAIVLNWPFTLFVMMKINKQIEATSPANADNKAVDAIRRWGKLHAVRTALGFSALVSFLFAML